MSYTSYVDAWIDRGNIYEVRCRYPDKGSDYLISEIPEHFEIFRGKVSVPLSQEKEVVLSIREGGFFDLSRSPILKRFREGTQVFDYLSKSNFFRLSRSPTLRSINPLFGLLKKLFN